MGLNPSALYRHLLSDLSDHMPRWVVAAVHRGDYSSSWFDSSPRSYAIKQQLLSLTKKYVDGTSAKADEAGMSKFRSVNNRLRGFRVIPETEKDEYLLGIFRDTFQTFVTKYVLPEWSLQDAFARGQVGPGASVGASGDDFYTKLFSSKLTSTSSDLYSSYCASASWDPRWYAAELCRRQHYGPVEVVEGNRLSFVPKTSEISRTICTEPSLNMFYQLGLGNVLRAALKRGLGVDLAVQQSKNRALARLGSLNALPMREQKFRFGGFSTIDLASASDSVSLGLCQWLFPKWLLGLLLLTRSPVTRFGNELIELQMLSTMGNGYTFPLQTAIFACVVLAVYEWRNIRFHMPHGQNLGNWAAYGDDIICHSESYADVTRLLRLLGFEVNHEKSFNEGLFRESCGGDFFLGHDVRGVYLKDLSSTQLLYSAINRLNRWSAKWQIPLPSLIGELKPRKLLFVPRWESDDCGVHVPMSVILPYARRSKLTGSLLYRKWAWKAQTLRVDANEQTVCAPKRESARVFNPEGLGLAFLGGYLRSDRITIRSDRGVYELKTGVCPSWDCTQIGSARLTPSSTWHNWDSYVVGNMFGWPPNVSDSPGT